MKILSGLHRPDAGRILLDGEPVEFHGPADAQRAGVAVIYQEPTLFPDLSVTENVFMGRQPIGRFGRIDIYFSNAGILGRLGGLGVLNLEGLWTRYQDPEPIYEEIASLSDEKATRRMQELYAEQLAG